MKTFITALISCSLVLGAVAMAQQDEEQQKGKKKKSQQTSQAQAQPQTSATAQGQQAGPRRGKGAGKREEQAPTTANTPTATGNANVQEGGKHKGKAAHTETTPAATESTNVNATQERGKRKGKAAETATSPAATENANVNATEGAGKKGKRGAAAMKQPSASPAATAGTSTAGSGTAKIKSGTVGKNGKTVDVQKIKAQHTSFRAQPKPEKIKSVTFNQNYRIVNAERWQGPQYEVFRTYQPAWHDAGWYRSNFAQVALIGGGYYAFNNGYWYPAWGYDPAAQYYAYDAPIYVGSSARPPDQVIADVQAELQEMGYYQGEVDGLLGPLTREALTAYQSDHGLYTTAVIDQPTLDALGIA